MSVVLMHVLEHWKLYGERIVKCTNMKWESTSQKIQVKEFVNILQH